MTYWHVLVYKACSNESSSYIWPNCGDAVTPAAGQAILCRGDLSAGASRGWISQCPWGLFLTASTPSPRTIPKHVSFEQSLHLNYLETFFLLYTML